MTFRLMSDSDKELRKALNPLIERGGAGLSLGNVKHNGFRSTFVLKLMAAHPELVHHLRLRAYRLTIDGQSRVAIGRAADIAATGKEPMIKFSDYKFEYVLFVGTTWRTNVLDETGAIFAAENKRAGAVYYYVLPSREVGDALDDAFFACGSDVEAGIPGLDLTLLIDAIQASVCGRVYPSALTPKRGRAEDVDDDDESPPPAKKQRLESMARVQVDSDEPPPAVDADTEPIESPPAAPVGAALRHGVADLKALVEQHPPLAVDLHRHAHLISVLATLGHYLVRLAAAAIGVRRAPTPIDRTIEEVVMRDAAHAVDGETERLVTAGVRATREQMVQHVLHVCHHDLACITTWTGVGCIADQYMTPLDDPGMHGDQTVCRACQHRLALQEAIDAAPAAAAANFLAHLHIKK